MKLDELLNELIKESGEEYVIDMINNDIKR